MRPAKVVGFYSDTLPHWVVDHGRYAVTLRTRGSIPREVFRRLSIEAEAMRKQAPESDAAYSYQRQLFAIIERELHRSQGFVPFAQESAADAVFSMLCDYDQDGIRITDFVVMPNHLHLITDVLEFENDHQFKTAWSGLKARTARRCNRALRRAGQFWQDGWYDRWIRDDDELQRWIRYLEQNPVKAKLCHKSSDYPWLKTNSQAGQVTPSSYGCDGGKKSLPPLGG